MKPSIQEYLNQSLREALHLEIHSLTFKSIGGGCINETYQLRVNDNIQFFVKVNSAIKFPGLFEKEKGALEFIAKLGSIRVPAVVAFDKVHNDQILVLEWIEEGVKTVQFWESFGEQLATLHRHAWTNKDDGILFGFSEDNYIGSLPQSNTVHQSWVEFFIQCRLQPQIKLSQEKRLLQSKHLRAFESLFKKLENIFNEEESALLHGDLWSGNFMCNINSEPVLIDPAVYFGHRSMDLAMTTLFGGFDRAFYESYNYHFPFPKNHYEQWEICNLYPLLIHLNLFGVGYLDPIERTLRRFGP